MFRFFKRTLSKNEALSFLLKQKVTPESVIGNLSVLSECGFVKIVYITQKDINRVHIIYRTFDKLEGSKALLCTCEVKKSFFGKITKKLIETKPMKIL